MGHREQGATRTLTTIDRAIDLVYILMDDGPLGVTAIADRMDMSKGTAHAYLSTLRQRGILSKTGTQYELGLDLLKLGNHVRKQTKIYKYGKEEAFKLAAQTDGQVHLAVEDDFEVVYVFRVPGDGADDVGSTIGDTSDLHATGAGKAILSSFSDERIEQYLTTTELTRYTSNTIVDPVALREEIELIRQQGFAVANEEQVLGAGTVGAPVVMNDGEVIGAITISVPATRLQNEHQQIRLGDLVNESSDRITMGVGFQS